VNKFATRLSAMHEQLAGAQVFSSKISRNYGDIVPKIVHELEYNAGKIAEHHKSLAVIADEVKALARGIQGKIAAVLSALQIGDITRQRIEHIRSSFVFFDEFRASDEAAALDPDAIARIDGAISQLAAAQMQETVIDFQRECRKVLETMSRFVDDTRDILALRDQMQRQSDDGNSNFLRNLEANVAAASKLVESVHETSVQADSVARSTSATAHSLLEGIEIIRSIKIDIHYMALNSNLRCSKLGDEGRSVNVVSAELRFFAEKLEAPADAVLSELQHFEAAAGSLSQGRESDGIDVSRPLNEALGSIRQVSGRMDESIREFEREGQEVFTKVSAAIGTLDFESELGDVLDDCVETANQIADLADADISDLAADIAGLGARIYRAYTMAPERDVHRQYFPMEAAAAAAPVMAAAQNDEDLFEDALF
jgi:methyl-accepting chemotaxis protein